MVIMNASSEKVAFLHKENVAPKQKFSVNSITSMQCDITTTRRVLHQELQSRVSTFITSGDESAQRATSDES